MNTKLFNLKYGNIVCKKSQLRTNESTLKEYRHQASIGGNVDLNTLIKSVVDDLKILEAIHKIEVEEQETHPKTDTNDLDTQMPGSEPTSNV